MPKTLLAAATVALTLFAPAAAGATEAPLDLDPLGRVQLGGAESTAFHAASERAFVTDAPGNALHVVSVSDPTSPELLRTVDLGPYGGGPNSVAVSPAFGGLIAVAVEAETKTDRGSVVLFDRDGHQRGQAIRVGALPDQLSFTPDGRTLLVANEGEPNDLYTVDPQGSVTVIDFEDGVGNPRVRTAGFTGVPRDGPVRLFGFGSPTPAQDLEPEYIATDGERAWVTLQENNAIGLLDVDTATFTKVRALGFKDHGLAGNGIDASDRDNGIGSTLPTDPDDLLDGIFPRPGVNGMYQPDAIATISIGGELRLVTANEGDARVYPPADIPGGAAEGSVFNEEVRVGGIAGLGYTIGGSLVGKTANAELGRLTVTKPSTVGVTGLTQAPGATVTSVYAFGGRSMSVLDTDASVLSDTGDELERLTYSGNGDWFAGDRQNFNKSNSSASALDDRSDNKGPEPEGVATGRVAGTPYAFLVAERAGSIFAFDLSDPSAPLFSGYANTRPADLGPEVIAFVRAGDSPSGKPLLLVGNEISGTLTVLEVKS